MCFCRFVVICQLTLLCYFPGGVDGTYLLHCVFLICGVCFEHVVDMWCLGSKRFLVELKKMQISHDKSPTIDGFQADRLLMFTVETGKIQNLPPAQTTGFFRNLPLVDSLIQDVS